MWEARTYSRGSDKPRVLGRSENIEDLKGSVPKEGKSRVIYFWTEGIPKNRKLAAALFRRIIDANGGDIHLVVGEFEVTRVGGGKGGGCPGKCFCVVSDTSSWRGCQAFYPWGGYTTITPCGVKNCIEL